MNTNWWLGIFILITFIVPIVAIFGDDVTWARGEKKAQQ